MKRSLVLLFAVLAPAQDPKATPPLALQKAEVEYPAGARAAGVRGKVLLDLVVDEKGTPGQIFVALPLGYGLDEAAVLSVSNWKFKPGRKNGKPAKMATTVEVEFNLFDYSTNGDRLALVQSAMNTINSAAADRLDKDEAVFTLERLSREGYGAALYYRGLLARSGVLVPKDDLAFVKDLRAAAARMFPPALYDLATLYQAGEIVGKDEAKALEFFDMAAKAGHKQATKLLATRFEKGEGGKRDVEQAIRYYRLCAVQGDVVCQLRLGQLLVENKGQEPRGLVYGLAWLELVKLQGDLSPAILIDQEMSASEELRQAVPRVRELLALRLGLSK